MQVEEYLLVCLMFFVAFVVHSVQVARAGDDKVCAPVEMKMKNNVMQGRGGLLNVRIQCNRLT
jgi:hypothetical protein